MTVAAHQVVAPRLAKDLDDRLESTSLVALGAAEPDELLLPPTDAEPEDQPPVRQHVDRRRVLGEVERVEHRCEEHARAERDALRARRDRREDRELRRHVAVVHEVVLARPDRLEPDPLGFDRQIDDLAVDLDVGARGRRGDAGR